MSTIKVKTLKKLLTVFHQSLRHGSVLRPKQIGELIGISTGHAYNYMYAVEEILRMQREPIQMVLQAEN